MSKKRIWITLSVLLLYTTFVWALSWFFLGQFQWIPIALVFTACGITVAVVYWLVARLGGAQDQSVAPPVAPSKTEHVRQAPEDLTVRELLKEAERQFAASPLLASERVRPRLADLPLYILMGPEGSGKTSNFVNGDLSPVALAGQVFRNESIIPTVAANLWYARRALVAETSGLWFSEGGPRWEGFLSALRSVRSSSAFKNLWQGPPPNNLRGVILFLDASNFVGIPDTSRLAALARTVQDRLRSAASAFSVDIPVWVVFSKADSLPFFSDYFSRLQDVEDQQPLGCTVDLMAAQQRGSMEVYAEAETRRLNENFDLLCSSLSQHRLPFLARESAPQPKRGIYEFPRELKQRVRGTLVQFLVEVFRPNALQPGPLLRGFYFTGTRQVPAVMGQKAPQSSSGSDVTISMQGGSIADWEAKAAMTVQSGRAPQERMVDRWSFVSQLLHQVVRPDQSGARSYVSQRAGLYRKIAFGTAIGLCLVLSGTVLWSAWNNSEELSQLHTAGAKLQGASLSGRDAARLGLPNLDMLRERLAYLNTWEESRPWRLGFLLYQGSSVSDRARDTWERYFREYLLQPILNGLTSEFSSLPPQNDEAYPYDRIYDHVKTYVTATSQECAATPQLADALMQGWQTWRTTGDDQADLVRKQFDFFAAELIRKRMRKVPVVPALKRGQGYLNDFSEAQRLYSQLVEDVSQEVGAAQLANYAPKYADVLSDVRDIPGAFTQDGWTKMQARIAGAEPKRDSCVLGTPPKDVAASVKEQVKAVTGPALAEQLQRLYATDYIRRWREMLAAVQVRSYADARDAEKKLDILDGDMTLLALMLMTRDQTQTVGSPPDAASKLAEVAEAAVGKRVEQSRVGGIAKQAASTIVPAKESHPSQDPATAFQPVTVMFSAESSRRNFNDPKNASYTAALNSLRKAMRDLADSSDANDAQLNTAAKKAYDDGIDSVRAIGRQFNNDAAEVGDQVSRLLNAPFEAARKHYVANPAKVGADALNSAGESFCSALRPLTQKYPFSTNGPDASIDEVSKIFNPVTGELSKFYTGKLSSFLVNSDRGYAMRADAPPGIKISPQFVTYLNRLMRISDALYADGAATPGMRYRLSLGQNPDVPDLFLAMDGQQVNWNGSPQSIKISRRTEEVPLASYDGPWAVFSLMAEADPRAPRSREVTISRVWRSRRSQPETIPVNGKDVSLHLKIDAFPGGVESAFDSDFFSVSKCVLRVVDR